MVDNRVSSVPSSYFKPGDANAMANKMSEEKYGQGGEYFNQELQEEQKKEDNFHDRSAILRASLNGLAAANAGAVRLMRALKEREEKEKENKKEKQKRKFDKNSIVRSINLENLKIEEEIE